MHERLKIGIIDESFFGTLLSTYCQSKGLPPLFSKRLAIKESGNRNNTPYGVLVATTPECCVKVDCTIEGIYK